MPATNAISNRFYPQLSDVITVDDLPDFLDFAKDGLDSFLSSIHYKNLQYSKSQRGDSASYKVDIISKNLGLDLPFGLRFVLNPDVGGDTSISSFPVTLQYQWQIISFLRSFSLPNVSLDPDGLFQLGLQIFKVTDQQVIAHILNFFVDPADTSTTKYQQLVDDINALYPAANLTIPTGQTPTVNLIAQLISQDSNIPKSISEVLFAAYILNTDLGTTKSKLQQFFNLIVPGGAEDYIKKLIKPWVKASLTLSAGIEFPTNILQPVDAYGVIIPNEKSVFQFAEATFTVDSNAGIGTQLQLGGSLIPTYAQIGNTGLIISFTDAKVDLSRTTNIPEATAAGYPPDFTGLYIQQASVSFNKFGQDDTTKTSASLTASNMLIGTGGISGTIKLEDNGILYRKFGNFSVELDTFELTFKMGTIVSSNISGKLILPGGFQNGGGPAEIDIDVAIKDNGDFAITAKVVGTPPSFTFPNVFTVAIRSLAVGEKNGRFFVSIGGTLDFITTIPGLGDVMPKGIIINKLTIWDDGSIEFEGGGLTIPKAFKLSVGPVKLEVSHLSIGSHSRQHLGIEREYYYFGFDGTVNTGNAGVEAAGNGIKFYFTHDDGPGKPFDFFLSIDSIAIDITIPGNASYDDAMFILKGYLSMKNPDPNITGSSAGVEYTGKVSFDMPKVGIAGSAAMRLQPSVPAFVVDIGLQLPVAIPLGPTGLGVYAFRGLIGQHYLPSKQATTPPLPETADWWDYYKAKSTITHTEGIEVDKFASKPGFSIGAGVSLATDFGDGGWTLSTKVFLMLGLPDVFLIQGQANILSTRLGLDEDTDPPFSALIVFSSDSIMGDLGINLKLPSGGEILKLSAKLEAAFFFNNASGWYLNIGRDTPESAQVQASILEIFKGHAYLMISSQGIKAGAGISFDFNKKFGPVQLWANAYLNLGGFVSFKPIQIGGFLAMGGGAGIKVGWFKLSVSLDVIFAVEAPHPFSITGTLKLKIHTPWPLPNVKINASIGWTFNNDDSPLKVPISILGLPDPANGYSPAAAHNILTNEVFPINYITTDINGNISASGIPHPGDSSWKYNFTNTDDVQNVIIPLDSFIDIDLLKPVLPLNLPLGGAVNQLPDGYVDMVPPRKGKSNQVKHQYEMTGVGIYAWSDAGNTWVPYDIYEAVTALVNANPGVDFSQQKIGYWQFSTKDRYNKIRLLAQNMFSYTNGTTKNNLDMDGRNYQTGDLFCYDNIQKLKVVNWKALPAGISYLQNIPLPYKSLTFDFIGLNAGVQQESGFNAHALMMNGGQGELIVGFHEPVAYAKLEFGESFNGDDLGNASVNFIQTTYTPDDNGKAVAKETVISSAPISQQSAVITYDDVTTGIDKVEVVFANTPPADYNGDLVLGGHFQLADQYSTSGLNGDIEMEKSLMFSTFYNRSFTADEVLELEYRGQAGTVAQFPLNSNMDDAGSLNALLSGSPDMVPGFYDANNTGTLQVNDIYSYTGNSDALVLPYSPVLKVENGSFAFESTVVFDPFTTGVSTILSKVNTDAAGNKKGFALHLLQNTPADPQATYSSISAIPTFTILLTCYDGLSSTGVSAMASYTLDCASSKVIEQQYKRILVSVDRVTGKLEIYIDRELKTSVNIPAQLNAYASLTAFTFLNQLSYITLADQTRQVASPITPEDVFNQTQVLSDSINNSIQPVWRPDTTFAITVTTQDRVNGSVPSGSAKTRIFGFRTAGPLGHFHQYSPVYQALAAQDQADAFKLANLQFYIDYDRSFPDAQGRYNLSKPVLYHNPQVKLYFTEPYINAMYADWNTYQDLPAVQSSLQLQLLDPTGAAVTQSLVWAPVQETVIDDTNFDSLPHDQQMIYLFNRSSSLQHCGQLPANIVKRLKQGSYQFPDLEPNTLYTALFKAVYTADGNPADAVEVYKFSFLTSRFANFQEQASSYILSGTGADAQYAIYRQNVSFAASYIAQDLAELINDDLSDDPSYALRYAGKFERLVFGGLQLPAPEPFEHSAVSLIVNTDPSDSTNRKILGIMVYNPEPFNDPKLPAADLVDTIKMTLTLPDATVLTPDQFIVSYSRDNSMAFITNSALDVPLGSIQLSFRYKQFNGIDYETVFEDYIGDAIDITPYF